MVGRRRGNQPDRLTVNVTEIFQNAGTFNGELHPATPDNIMTELREALGWTGDTTSFAPADGHIIVTKQHGLPPTIIDPDVSHYTGRLTKLDGNRFEGHGPASWLGAGGRNAQIRQTPQTTNQDAEAWVDDYVAAGNGNGITKGTNTTTDATTYTLDWEYTRPFEHLNKMCSALGFEWRINAALELDVNTAANLFTQDSVLITREPEGESGDIRGVNGRVVSWTIDAGDLMSRSIVVDGTGTVQYVDSSGTVAYDITGTAAVLQDLADAPGTDSTTATSIATATVGLYEQPRFSFEVAAKGRVRDHVTPGDTIYVYDPPAIQDLDSAVVVFRGQPTFPVSVRVQRLVWSVTKGHGVYLYRNSGSAAVTDLTPYMVWPDDVVSITVGTSKGPGDRVDTLGPALYNPDAFTRLV